MTERERMEKGILYNPGDEEILAEKTEITLSAS